MDKRLFESKMKLYGDTNASLAKALGLSEQSVSSKKNNTKNKQFTLKELKVIKERYNLSAEEMDLIFFTHQVP